MRTCGRPGPPVSIPRQQRRPPTLTPAIDAPGQPGHRTCFPDLPDHRRRAGRRPYRACARGAGRWIGTAAGIVAVRRGRLRGTHGCPADADSDSASLDPHAHDQRRRERPRAPPTFHCAPNLRRWDRSFTPTATPSAPTFTPTADRHGDANCHPHGHGDATPIRERVATAKLTFATDRHALWQPGRSPADANRHGDANGRPTVTSDAHPDARHATAGPTFATDRHAAGTDVHADGDRDRHGHADRDNPTVTVTANADRHAATVGPTFARPPADRDTVEARPNHALHCL